MTLHQDQLALLHQKIDGLHRMIEELNTQIAFVLSDQQPTASVNDSIYVHRDHVHRDPVHRDPESHHEPRYGSHHVIEPSYQPVSQAVSMSIANSYDEEMMGHKDVIIEPDYIDSDRSTTEQPLTSEVQVQRLTAQLTAAYNRIAALEEQLLSHRIQ